MGCFCTHRGSEIKGESEVVSQYREASLKEDGNDSVGRWKISLCSILSLIVHATIAFP